MRINITPRTAEDRQKKGCYEIPGRNSSNFDLLSTPSMKVYGRGRQIICNIPAAIPAPGIYGGLAAPTPLPSARTGRLAEGNGGTRGTVRVCPGFGNRGKLSVLSCRKIPGQNQSSYRVNCGRGRSSCPVYEICAGDQMRSAKNKSGCCKQPLVISSLLVLRSGALPRQ